ncbi:MAG: VOC family protein [Burkholderiaceae bacterium]
MSTFESDQVAAAAPATSRAPSLHGVHHAARPIWKLADTLHFYGEVMGLELIHVITAKGWGRDDHPDFLHLFFDGGNGSAIAFFYYLGSDAPPYWTPDNTLLTHSVHTAWAASTRDELLAWRAHFESHGLKVRQVRHEVVESIYVDDPTGYMVEVAWQCRPFSAIDRLDAALTIDAALAAERAAAGKGERLSAIEPIWRAKAQAVRTALATGDSQ